MRSELDSVRNSQRRNNDDDHLSSSLVRALQSMALGNAMPSMNGGMGMSSSPMHSGMGMPFSPMHSGMEMPYSSMHSSMPMPSQSMRSSSGSIGGAHGGRFTGEHMVTNGAANGRPVYEGSRGGQYYMTPGGHKSYIRK